VSEPAIVGSSASLSSVAEGDASASVEVATFTHANAAEAAGAFTATVNWRIAGHTADTGTVTLVGSTYHVTASRPVFTEEGSYTATVSISEDNPSLHDALPISVSEPAIVGSSASLSTVAEGDASASVEVATF